MPKGQQTIDATTPSKFADTLAPEVVQGHTFSVQALFEFQRSFGKVENAVESLKEQIAEQAKTLRSIELKIALATGAFVIISTIVGIFITYGLNVLGPLLSKH